MRQVDRLRVGILGCAVAVAAFWPAVNVWAQSQDTINATLGEQVKNLSFRLDRIDNYMSAVLLALVLNFIAQVVQIKRAPERRQ